MLLHGVPSEHPSKLAGTSGLPGALPRKRPCPGAKHGKSQSLDYLSFKNFHPGFDLDGDLGMPCGRDVEEAPALEIP